MSCELETVGLGVRGAGRRGVAGNPDAVSVGVEHGAAAHQPKMTGGIRCFRVSHIPAVFVVEI